MSARSRIALGVLFAGSVSLLLGYGEPTFLVATWLLLGAGLGLLLRDARWRRAARVSLTVHSVLLATAILAAGLSLGFGEHALGGFRGLAGEDDGLLTAVALIGPALGVTIALAMDSHASWGRRLARASAVAAGAGLAIAFVSLVAPGVLMLIGVPAIVMAILAPVATGWALAAASGNGGHERSSTA